MARSLGSLISSHRKRPLAGLLDILLIGGFALGLIAAALFLDTDSPWAIWLFAIGLSAFALVLSYEYWADRTMEFSIYEFGVQMTRRGQTRSYFWEEIILYSVLPKHTGGVSGAILMTMKGELRVPATLEAFDEVRRELERRVVMPQA